MRLSPHFSMSEFLRSQTAQRHGIDMTPTPEVTMALRDLCVRVLEPFRELIGKPMIISSGYRPLALNILVGGSATSQHMKGEAADVLVPGMAPLEVWNRLRESKILYDQTIDEFGQWTHISYRRRNCRRMALVATRLNGRVEYDRVP